MLDNLKKYKVLLASKSPRRRELLSQMRIPYTPIAIGNIDESYPSDLIPEEVPQYVTKKKAAAYAKVLNDHELIITADTMVICEGQIFGKPEGREEAIGMLRKLSGRKHTVVTGVCIKTIVREVSFSVSTEVEFTDISHDDIEYYVDNFQPFDKAGAYGIQEWIGCVAIKGIKGSFYNVMGLPVHRLYSELRSF